MKIRSVTVNYGVTVSYAKYRMVRIDQGMTVDLNPDEDGLEVADGLRKVLREEVAKAAKKEVTAWRKLGAKVEALSEPDNFDFE